MPYKSQDEESYLREQIAKLHREYQAAIKPYVDQLVYIESMKPLRMFAPLTRDEFAVVCDESWKRFSTPVKPE